jgi:IMP dehydrogenase/GMP reductase
MVQYPRRQAVNADGFRLGKEISMRILPDVALTYDDVLLVPQYSDIASRKQVSTCTILTAGIPLQIPIISANMDTVTESDMAIAMAREGGIGIIHRFMPIEDQEQQIARVKKAESFVVLDPILLKSSATVAEARRIFEETGTGGVLVVDGGDTLVGIVTTRDLLFEADENRPVTEVMQHEVVTAPPSTTLDEAKRILHALGGQKRAGRWAHYLEGYSEDRAVPVGNARSERSPGGGRRGWGSRAGTQAGGGRAGRRRRLHRGGHRAR